jgi:hypothetical protein
MSVGHSFAPPWSVEEQDGCFVIRDGNGRALSCVYFKDEHGRRSAAALFTRDEARHLAAAVAKLPDLFPSGTRSDCCDRPTERKRLEVNRRSIPAGHNRWPVMSHV